MSCGSFCQWSAASVDSVVFPILVLNRALKKLLFEAYLVLYV